MQMSDVLFKKYYARLMLQNYSFVISYLVCFLEMKNVPRLKVKPLWPSLISSCLFLKIKAIL